MMNFLKKTVLAFVVIICGLLVLTSFPSNRYLRAVARYGAPNVDDYRIFANRTVKAGQPQQWRVSADYNRARIPSGRLPYFEALGTVAYVVVRDSAIVFEQYWDGYGDASLSNSFSVSKSIVSLLAGIARDEGKIASFDQPVATFYPPYASDNRKEITIKHLLTMSSGLGWDEAYGTPFSITTKAYYGDRLEPLIAGLRLVETPGIRYRFQSGITQLLSFVVANAVGQSLSEYASEKLWTPIGAENDALWSLDRAGGVEKAYCCFNTNARDFARIGQLVLNRGKWNGRQVVSERYIDEAVTPASWLKDEDSDRSVDFYGYQWWRLTHDGMDVIYARGILGQYLFIVPDRNMVVVRLGYKCGDRYTADDYPEDVDVWLDTAFEIIQSL